MSKLIDADKFFMKAYNASYPVIHGNNDRENGLTMYGIAQLLDEQPTVDAVPVVHGYWKGYRFPKYRGNDDFGEPIFKEYVAYTCSNCRKQNAIRHKYCPMCGAIMDGVME